MEASNTDCMVRFLFILTLTLSTLAHAQTDSARMDILKFHDELNEEFKNPKTSPLKGKDLKRFKQHEFFPVDLRYRVLAAIEVTPSSAFFQMPTSSADMKDYRVYGTITFELLGKKFQVPVYQSKMLMNVPKYKSYLFFPFTDLTNGTLTYGAGRYLELSIPEAGNIFILDFNKAYNPYCAYSDGYSCPLVPAENNLDVEILAGVKYVSKKKKH